MTQTSPANQSALAAFEASIAEHEAAGLSHDEALRRAAALTGWLPCRECDEYGAHAEVRLCWQCGQPHTCEDCEGTGRFEYRGQVYACSCRDGRQWAEQLAAAQLEAAIQNRDDARRYGRGY